MLKALTFIGSSPNKYSPTTYYIERDGKRESCTTHLFPEVVVELYQPTELIAFATDEVLKDIHGHGYLKHLRCVCSNHKVSFSPKHIPSGKSTNELWEIFDVYANAVNDGDEIILDITHGFRSLPMLALPAISYLRQVKKNVEFKHILYGAFEAKDRDENETPIFDLTPFVDLLDWTNAVNVFQRSGDASDITKMKVSTGDRELRVPNQIVTRLNHLSNALLLNRTLEAQEEASKFTNLSLDNPKSLPWQPAPFKTLTEKLKEPYQEMSVDSPKENLDESLRGQYAQIKWYVDNHHYLHAITLIREWLVSSECRESRLNWLEDQSREWAERRLNTRNYDLRKSELLSTATGIDKLWADCNNLRNDLAHCGMREKDITDANKAIQAIKNLFGNLEVFAQAKGVVP